MRLEELTAALRDRDVAQRVLPDVQAELGIGSVNREAHERVLRKYLEVPTELPRSWLPRYQARWDRKIDLRQLIQLEPSQSYTTLEFETVGLDNKIVGYREVTRTTGPQVSAKNSTSLDRPPADHSTLIRGKSTYFPFAPGGLDGNVVISGKGGAQNIGIEDLGDGDAVEALEKAIKLTAGGIRTIPPGFERGLDFGEAAAHDAEEMLDDEGDERVLEAIKPVYRPPVERKFDQPAPKELRAAPQLDAAIAETLPDDRLFLPLPTKPKNRRPVVSKRDWAHVVDVSSPISVAAFNELVPQPARVWPFTLDGFQREAIYHMEQGDSVFVAAHTSAGKTVVAEYAIAMASNHMTRAIYTSPIKALSNQKFRDFKQTFSADGVGILTGDVQINPEASCLIMTTEILRSMLYKGADLIRDIEWVIFDEVHYVNDAERGVVWEEVIIMLPDHVNIVLLSATVPNTKEFADWVGRTKRKDLYVISTPKRPVPLEHHLYANRDIFKIVDSRGEFLGQGLKDTSEALRRKQDKEREAAGLPPVVKTGGRGGPPARGQQRGGRGAPAARGGQRGAAPPAVRGRALANPRSGGTFNKPRAGGAGHDRNLWVHLVGMLRQKQLLPAVCFTFSKKRCEENAGSMTNTDLCTAAEKSEIHIVIERSITRLKGSDRKLPQIARMRDLLSRGIAVHHGGLLPIVKEMVEILFSRGLVKVLFATETFAMGVNMPARTVVFAQIRKHDGRGFRDLLAGEYTQMSGRAGRRGLDATGMVIIVCDSEVPDTTTLHKMILGQPTKLSSQFRLTYNMILNLLRVEALRVEEMIKRSFSENASQRLLPDQQKLVTEGELELKALPKLEPSVRVDAVRRFYDLSTRLVDLNQTLLQTALTHGSASKIFVPGRVLVLRDNHFPGTPALLLRAAPPQADASGVLSKERHFFVLAAVTEDIKSGRQDVEPDAVAPRWPCKIVDPGNNLVYEVRLIASTSISMVTRFTQKIDISAIVDRNLRSAMTAAVTELAPVTYELAASPISCEVDWSKIRQIEFREAIGQRNELVVELNALDIDTDGDFDEIYSSLHAEGVLQRKVSSLRMAISEQNLELLPEYEQRILVLQDLGFIDANSTVLLKGRVACEINTAHELILTELILENVLGNFEPEEVVALLSAFVFTEKTDEEPVLTPRLLDGKKTLLSIADRIARAQTERRATSDDGFGGETLRFGLCEVVYEWAKGTPFAEVCELTDVLEGSIVRIISRLDETCREVRDAARVIGDATLYVKMETARERIHRDVVFCNSLYL